MSTTFSKAFSLLIIKNALLGSNLKFGCDRLIDAIFILQMFVSLGTVFYSILKAEFDSDDITKFSLSIVDILSAIFSVSVRIVYRYSTNDVARLIKKIDKLFIKFNGDESQHLVKLRRVIPAFVLIPAIPISLALVSYIERLNGGSHQVAINNEKLNRFSKKFDFMTFHKLFLTPVNCCVYMDIYSTMSLMFSTVTFIFKYLANYDKLNYSTLPRYISIHRDACNVLRMTEKAFRNTFFCFLCLLMSLAIFYSRLVTLPSQLISLLTVASIVFLLGLLMVQILAATSTDKNLRRSLLRLQTVQLEVQTFKTQSAEKINTLSSLTDLYVTSILLDTPRLTISGLIQVNNRLIPVICGIILSYTIILYAK
ncbi:hypothetical protein CHUAL_009786 [Chamberlinius hualienensis]